MSDNASMTKPNPSELPESLLFESLTGTRSEHRKRAFLIAYIRTFGIRRAEQLSGVSTDLHYVWLKKDPLYNQAFLEAQQIAGDILEEEAFRRAVPGVTEDVYYQGEVVGQKVSYSDGLLKMLLSGAKPARYRENFDLTTDGKGLRIVLETGGQPPLGFDNGKPNDDDE